MVERRTTLTLDKLLTEPTGFNLTSRQIYIFTARERATPDLIHCIISLIYIYVCAFNPQICGTRTCCVITYTLV